MKNKLVTLYLDWHNNWLTVQAMADHYSMEITRMERCIQLGRQLNNPQ